MGAQTIAVGALDPADFAQSIDRLAEILHACVHEGASVGFVLPFGMDEARGYWRDKVAPSHAAGAKLVLVGDPRRRCRRNGAARSRLDAEQAPSR